MRRLLCALPLCVCLVTRSTLAASQPSVVIEVAIGTTCGDAASAMRTRAAARGVSIVTRGEAGDTAATATVRVLPKDDAMEGTLVLSRSDRTTNTRVVTAATCDEVFDALAFTLSLALEGEATAADTTAPPPPPPSPTLVATSSTPTIVAADRVVEQPAAPREPWKMELAFGAGGGAITGASPTVQASIAAWGMIGGTSASSSSRRLFNPALIVSGRLSLPTETSVPNGGAARVTTGLQVVGADVCPARIGSPSLRLRPCARVVVGRSQVRSEGFQDARLEDRVFASIGPSAWLEAKIAGPLFLEAEFGLGIPFDRSSYFVGDSRVFGTPAAAISSSLGAGVHLF